MNKEQSEHNTNTIRIVFSWIIVRYPNRTVHFETKKRWTSAEATTSSPEASYRVKPQRQHIRPSCKYTVHSILTLHTIVFPCDSRAMLDSTVSIAARYLPRLGDRTTPWKFDTATATTTRRTAAAAVAATRGDRICSGQIERKPPAKGRQASSLTLPASILARVFSHPNDRYANRAMRKQSHIPSTTYS